MDGKFIETRPDVCGGAPVITGTHVPVEVLAQSIAAGDSIAETAKNYRLTEEQVCAACQYVADHAKQ